MIGSANCLPEANSGRKPVFLSLHFAELIPMILLESETKINYLSPALSAYSWCYFSVCYIEVLPNYSIDEYF